MSSGPSDDPVVQQLQLLLTGYGCDDSPGFIQGLLARAERNVPASGSFAKAPSEPTVIQSR